MEDLLGEIYTFYAHFINFNQTLDQKCLLRLTHCSYELLIYWTSSIAMRIQAQADIPR